ncbi:MAG: transposase [Euryarchaeota archaeon]|nr:transposase [Euryarchaeota archaeon]
MIRECLEAIRFFEGKIEVFDSRIFQSLKGMQKELEILMSMPGISFTIAAGVLAEIGNINVFLRPKSLVSWSVIHHLLANNEKYSEEELKQKKQELLQDSLNCKQKYKPSGCP